VISRARLGDGETVDCPNCGRPCLVTTVPVPPEVHTIVCRDGAYVVGVGVRRLPGRLIDDQALIDATVAVTYAALETRRTGSGAFRSCETGDPGRWASFLAAL
jgi:hypothetical protein